MYKKIDLKLAGITPLLMNKFSENGVSKMMTIQEQCEACAYRNPETRELYVPCVALQRALIKASLFSKGKGRASLQRATAAGTAVIPEQVSLGVKEYAIDSRSVVIPTTKGRIMRHRPRLDQWTITFTIMYDDQLLTETQLKTIVQDMGQRVGLLDFRPEHNGSFGRSQIQEWSHCEQ